MFLGAGLSLVRCCNRRWRIWSLRVGHAGDLDGRGGAGADRDDPAPVAHDLHCRADGSDHAEEVDRRNIVSRATSSSRWKGCGSKSAAKALIGRFAPRQSLRDITASFHYLLCKRAMRIRGRTRPNQTPLATAPALIRPKAASAALSARKTWDRLPLQRNASHPPPAAIASRVRFASNGHSSRPAPCEAK